MMQKNFIKIYLIFFFVFLASCNAATETNPTIAVTFTSSENQTITLTPIKISPTPTSISLTATEVSGGTEVTIEKRVDEATGIEYEYECVNGICSRDAGTIHLFDTPEHDYIKVEWRIDENVLGQGSFVEISHKNRTNSHEKRTPVSGVVAAILNERYFPANTALTVAEQQVQLQNDMLGRTEGVVAQIPIITTTSDGKEIMVPLGSDKGIKIDITTPERMIELGGDENITIQHVADKATGKSYKLYIDVYAVDTDGNVLARLAFEDSIADIPEKVFRTGLLMIPGNFLDHIDQREQGITSSVRSIVENSILTQSDGKTVDVEIEIAPPINE